MDPRALKRMKGVIETYNTFEQFFGPLSEEVVTHPKVQKLIKSKEKFDVVIVSEFMHRFLRVLAHHFDASLVAFSNTGALTWFFDDVGNIIPPSIGPTLGIEMPYRMNFLQRLKNTMEKIRSVRWLQSNALRQNELIKKYFPKSPSIEEISKNISLVLLNAHPSTEVVRPLVPGIINIGGFHVKKPKKLPNDLQEIMDKAKDGVILFSFGSYLDPKMIAPEKLQEVIQVLAKRKETVLWKFAGELAEKPKNVVLSKWLPQQDILGKFFLNISYSNHD